MELNISYEHSLRHSYMHIKNITVPAGTYESRLLKETCIPGSLKMNHNAATEENNLCYVISGLESMEKYLESHPLTHNAISSFMECLNRLLSSLEEYMVSENSVFLSPSSVFFSQDNDEWLFTLIPSFENLFCNNLSDLLSYMLKHIDYNDDRAVIMAYSLFQESAKEFYQLPDLLRIVRTNMAKEQSAEKKSPLSVTTSDSNHQQETRTPVSDDGIFRPIDAGIVLRYKSENGNYSVSETASRNSVSLNKGNSAYDDQASVCGSFPPMDNPVIPSSSRSSAEACDIGFSSDYGKDDYPDEDLIPGVEIQDLSEEHPKLFGLFSFPRKNRKPGNVSEESMIRQQTIEESISEKNKQSSFKGKLIFTVLLMILIPSLVWFLKGGLIFKKAFPLILALEIGLCMMIALDLIMNKLPEDA
ncbi:hypothetical protein UYO_1828 [Lachnospiraceae bacterium JC7]|nr:hypothetical protein UYO_1828 [Lachnospiraceae bacterium JC7]